MNLVDFSNQLAEELSGVASRVQHSLVVVHNGRRGAGAGVIWRSEGYIITNHHVIGSSRPAVLLEDGRELPAQIVARDREVDLALLKIEASALQAVQIADSSRLQVGQVVLAAGHPWGQRNTVTAGIISSLGSVQVRGNGRLFPIIHSDVSLAPGSSGGPLVNTSGEVVGINTMIVGGDMSVAISSQVVEQFVSQAVGTEVYS
jgi:serine protease Do